MLKMLVPLVLPTLRMLPESSFHSHSGSVSVQRQGASLPSPQPLGVQAAGQSVTLVHPEVAVIPHKSTRTTSRVCSWVQFTQASR